MKKLMSLMLFTILAVSELHAQDGKTAPGDLGNPCPPPMCVVRARLFFDLFNFHKPRTNCTSGFGICIKTHFEYSCGYPPYCLSAYNKQSATDLKIENGKVTGWFNIVGTKAELHLPAAIELQTGFTADDTKLFHVDKDMIFFKNQEGVITSKVKAGAYPVKRSAQELLVIVDLEK